MKTLQFNLYAVPVYTPASDGLFLAGSFNQWNPADENYKFELQQDGTYRLEFETRLDFFECKITRGNWDSVETNPKGEYRPNRVFYLSQASEQKFQIGVHAWNDLKQEALGHSASSNVLVLHSKFPVPQLGRTRRIWAYLPPDYWFSMRHYPVIYMLDGQNLFDDESSFSGEWGVDEALNRLFFSPSHVNSNGERLACIIIGIDNGGVHRTDEYSPWKNAEYGGGEGNLFLDFITDNLKPYIDEHLRTVPGRKDTGIIGSSMGGLFTLFAALGRPNVFGMAGVFSPSLWFSAEVWDFIRKPYQGSSVRMLLMAGQQESERMASELLDLYELLLQSGHRAENLHYDLYPYGTHSENFWASTFEHAFLWLFGRDTGHDYGTASNEFFIATLHTELREIEVNIVGNIPQAEFHVMGYIVQKPRYFKLNSGNNRISFANWEPDYYLARIYSSGNLVFSRTFLIEQSQKKS